METPQFGLSTLSRLGLGCEQLGGTDWGKFDIQQAMQTVRHASDCGINVFDTADVYGLGSSEELLSRSLGQNRKRAFIISKCGIRWEAAKHGRARTFRDASAAYVTQAVESSLRRLRLETISAYLVHWPDPKTPIAETIEALESCRQAGKIRFIGVSNFSANQLQDASTAARLDFAEVRYNLLEREAETRLFPLCRQLGIAVAVYGPLAQGLLSGKYDSDSRFGSDDRRHRLPQFQPQALERNLKTVRRLQMVGRRIGYSPAQVAISWILAHPAVSCVIAGAKSPQQLMENAGALKGKLQTRDRAYLNGEIENL
jgi:aryl-alcohol dehydrogenase-like predicted oxidoreductase